MCSVYTYVYTRKETKMKSKEINSFIEQLSYQSFGRSRIHCISLSICVCCGNNAFSFKNEKSYKEYQISAFCQECQNSVFEE